VKGEKKKKGASPGKKKEAHQRGHQKERDGGGKPFTHVQTGDVPDAGKEKSPSTLRVLEWPISPLG